MHCYKEGQSMNVSVRHNLPENYFRVCMNSCPEFHKSLYTSCASHSPPKRISSALRPPAAREPGSRPFRQLRHRYRRRGSVRWEGSLERDPARHMDCLQTEPCSPSEHTPGHLAGR